MVAQWGALLAANDPQSPSHTMPRNTWPDSSSSLICHHRATTRSRLKLKQVIRTAEVRLGFFLSARRARTGQVDCHAYMPGLELGEPPYDAGAYSADMPIKMAQTSWPGTRSAPRLSACRHGSG
jgi:hypothetical protein